MNCVQRAQWKNAKKKGRLSLCSSFALFAPLRETLLRLRNIDGSVRQVGDVLADGT